MSEDLWGVGNKKDDPAFETGYTQGGSPYELIFGEHPHSRQDNHIYARYLNREIVAFDGHRVQIGVDLQTYNYLKSSELSGDELRKGGKVKIKFNNKQVYEFFFRDPLEALLTAREKVQKLLEFSVRLWKEDAGTDKLIGRKVFFLGQPGIITKFYDVGEVMIKADTPTGTFDKTPWDDYCDVQASMVKDDILSPHIYWFRDQDNA